MLIKILLVVLAVLFPAVYYHYAPTIVKISPGEPIGRAATRLIEQEKFDGNATDSNAIFKAYDDAVETKFKIYTDSNVFDSNAVITKKRYLTGKKLALKELNFDTNDKDKNNWLSREEMNISRFEFITVDIDKDSRVSMAEFWTFHHQTIVENFTKYDFNNDSSLNHSEYVKLLRNEISPIELKKVLDLDDNNKIDNKEMINAATIFNIKLKKTIQN